MAQQTEKTDRQPEPKGFGEHTRGLSAEYAHEQGWGLEVDERTHQASAPQETDGGTDYEYGARDFGDEPVNTKLAPAPAGPKQNKAIKKES